MWGPHFLRAHMFSQAPRWVLDVVSPCHFNLICCLLSLLAGMDYLQRPNKFLFLKLCQMTHKSHERRWHFDYGSIVLAIQHILIMSLKMLEMGEIVILPQLLHVLR